MNEIKSKTNHKPAWKLKFGLSALLAFLALPVMAQNNLAETSLVQINGDTTQVPSWQELLSHYTLKMGNADIEQSLKDAAQSENAYADNWRASDIEIVIHHETDMLNDDLPMRNWQIGAATTIVLPSQREARENLAQVVSAQSSSEQRYLDWLASAQIRELVWQLKKAEGAFELESQALEINKKLLDKVVKQVRLGEAAKLDELVTEQNLLAAQMAYESAKLEYQNNLKTYQALTGFTLLPAKLEETRALTVHTQHPEITRLEQNKALNEAQLKQISADKSGNPSVFLGLQQDTVESQKEDSVIFEVSFPLGMDPLNNRDQALQKIELTKNRVQMEQAKRLVELDLRRIESKLSSLHKSLDFAKQKWDMADQAYALSQQAYQLGEINIQTLLQIQQQKLESSKMLANAKLELGKTLADYNQKSGYLVGEKQ